MINTIVGNCLNFFEDFVELSKFVSKEQLLTRLFLYGYDEENVDDCLDEIRSKRMLLNRELRHLNKMASTFIDSYGTNSNNCFRDAADFFFYIRRLLIKQLKEFDKLRLENRRSYHYCFGRSNSLKTDFNQPFLPFVEEEICKPKLRELANEIIGFSNDVFDCISLCRNMMKEEMKIRKDYPRLRWVYERTIAEICENGKHLFSNFIVCPESIDEIEDSMTREMLLAETDNWNEILSKYYHQRTPTQLLIHQLLLNAFKAKYTFIPSQLEKLLWGDKWEMIMKARLAIKYFDEMTPKGSFHNKVGKHRLKGKSLAMLMNCCGITDEDQKKGAFMKYFNDTYRGEYLQIGNNAVYNAFNSWDESEYKEFEEQLNKLVEEKRRKEEIAA